MGKLLDRLRQVSQVSGSGMGFLGARLPVQKPRPAAIAVTLGTADVAVAEAVTKAGADVVIVTDWRPGAEIARTAAALGEGAQAPVWGVELVGESAASAEALSEAHEAGAAFVVLGPSAPVAALLEARTRDGLEIVIGIEPPTDDLGLVLLRAENLLPAAAALLRTPFSRADLATMSIGGFTRTRLLFETLRFPVLAPVAEPPDESQTRLLVRLGADGIVLSGMGATGASLAREVQAVKGYLEQTPANDDDRPAVAIGGLMEARPAAAAEPGRLPGEPPHEPGEE